MTVTDLYQELNFVDATRKRRKIYAELVLEKPQLVNPLLKILFMVDDKISCRAAWVLEFACKENINIITPYLDEFTNGINKVKLNGAIRPVAKISEILAETYFSDLNHSVKNALKKNHIEAIVETSFDYLINDEKIAPKAYSMNTLYLFGQNLKWIHPELKIILERDYQNQSAGFKARARHILKKLSKTK